MAVDNSKNLIIAISTRALFDMEKENEILVNEGNDAYCRYQRKHEHDTLQPGAGLSLIRTLLEANPLIPGELEVDVMVVSRDNLDTSVRIFNSIEQCELGITRGVFTGGDSIVEYLRAFGVDLFLSDSKEDVDEALTNKIPAAQICGSPISASMDEIRIAFDGDGSLFSEAAEDLSGPFATLLRIFSYIQKESSCKLSIRIAMLSDGSGPSRDRLVRTLRDGDLRADAAFYIGEDGVPREQVLDLFGPHMYFDGSHTRCADISETASTVEEYCPQEPAPEATCPQDLAEDESYIQAPTSEETYIEEPTEEEEQNFQEATPVGVLPDPE